MLIQKKILLCLVPMLILVCSSSAQRSVVSAGGDISNSSGVVSYSVGQTAYVPIEGEAGLIYAGVQQPNNSTAVGTAEISAGICAQVFPNPFNQTFYIQFYEEVSDTDLDQFSLRFYGMDGRLLWQSRVVERHTQVECGSFVEGVYLLQILHQQNETASVKLVKTN